MIGSCERVLHLPDGFGSGSTLEILPTSCKREVEPRDIDGHDLVPASRAPAALASASAWQKADAADLDGSWLGCMLSFAFPFQQTCGNAR